jgi:anti-sigma B factor antagonist
MVALVGEAVCVKISGRANFSLSIDFKRLVMEMAGRGYSRFIFDLSECVLMDSTFLGVLAGIALRFFDPKITDDQYLVELLNPNPRIADLLENLGIAHLFKIQNHGPECIFTPVAAEAVSRVEVTRNCLEAHRTLMSISPENIGKFKEVTQFLAQDLKKMEKPAS